MVQYDNTRVKKYEFGTRKTYYVLQKGDNIMQIQTKFFGEVDIAEDKVITLANGLMGFEENKKYVILYDNEKTEKSNISWLQSADEQSLALPVVNPLVIKKDYDPIVPDELLEQLGDPEEEGYMLLVTMRIPSDPKEISCNLKAPIIINTKTLLGAQLIVENEDYPVRYHLADAVEQLKEKDGE